MGRGRRRRRRRRGCLHHSSLFSLSFSPLLWGEEERVRPRFLVGWQSELLWRKDFFLAGLVSFSPLASFVSEVYRLLSVEPDVYRIPDSDSVLSCTHPLNEREEAVCMYNLEMSQSRDREREVDGRGGGEKES